MPFGTEYSVPRCKTGLFFFTFDSNRHKGEWSNKDKKKSYELGKARKIPRITAYQQKQLSEDHCGKQAHELRRATKLSFSSLNHWLDPKHCIHHQLVEEIDI